MNWLIVAKRREKDTADCATFVGRTLESRLTHSDMLFLTLIATSMQRRLGGGSVLMEVWRVERWPSSEVPDSGFNHE
jgi:hypothetical protein